MGRPQLSHTVGTRRWPRAASRSGASPVRARRPRRRWKTGGIGRRCSSSRYHARLRQEKLGKVPGVGGQMLGGAFWTVLSDPSATELLFWCCPGARRHLQVFQTNGGERGPTGPDRRGVRRRSRTGVGEERLGPQLLVWLFMMSSARRLHQRRARHSGRKLWSLPNHLDQTVHGTKS